MCVCVVVFLLFFWWGVVFREMDLKIYIFFPVK